MKISLEQSMRLTKCMQEFESPSSGGIGGLKRKWKRLMKGFDSTKQKFPDVFTAAAIFDKFPASAPPYIP
jgi:hypothetical protein